MKKAFTLVELIVVVTILGILSTIGFVSFSGYLSGTRDTNRIAQLKSMSEALNAKYIERRLPIPDNKIDVLADGDNIAYQGYIGANVLEEIDYSEKGLDPKDKEYFTYYLTKNKKHFQLLAFLEEENNNAILGNVSNSRKLANANILLENSKAVDYSQRFPKVSGKKLGILTDENNTPLQEVESVVLEGFLDVQDTTDNYTAYLSDDQSITSTGGTLQKLQYIALDGGKSYSVSGSTIIYNNPDLPSDGLLAEYLFDGDFQDNSGNGNDGTDVGGITFGKGIVGASASFDGNDDYVNIPSSLSLQQQETSFAWSYWFKGGTQTQTYARHIDFGSTETSLGSSTSHRLRSWIDTGGSRSTEVITTDGLDDNIWHHVVFQWDGNTITLYVDNREIGTTTKTGNITTYTGSFRIGGTTTYNGLIDNVRVYDEVLTRSEINALYNERK